MEELIRYLMKDMSVTKDVLLKLAYELKLTLAEADLLLEIFGFTIKRENIRDSLIAFALTCEFDIEEINELLREAGEFTFS